jgi:signal transduction histidine kinase
MTHDDRILVVDDEPAEIDRLVQLLGSAGYRQVSATTDPRRALELFRKVEPDLVVLDLAMPQLDGAAVLAQLQREIPPDVYLPVLVLTTEATLDTRKMAVAAGARDVLAKPVETFEILLRVRNLLDARRLSLALQAQKRSLETEKAATTASLLAGVAHELNNPLAVLSGHTQLLYAAGADPMISRRLLMINDAADRCVRIVRNFLALARQRPPERSPTALTQVIDAAIEMVAHELRADDVDTRVHVADDVPVLWADPQQLHQVFVNLVANAHQAMRRHRPPRKLRISGRHDRGGGRIEVDVTDTGPGIPAELQAKIFQPLFTTKAIGEGTGLGLSLCRGIVEGHGGTLALVRSDATGTTFRIDLPVLAPPARVMEAVAPPPALFTPHRVLVVDDEVAFAEVIAEAIERDGNTAVIAADGVAALDLLGRESYDLVISDTRMPLLDGEALYAEVERRFPRMRERIIFITGDVLAREKREFLERTGAPYLTKPCDLDEVRRTVQRVLAGADRGAD